MCCVSVYQELVGLNLVFLLIPGNHMQLSSADTADISISKLSQVRAVEFEFGVCVSKHFCVPAVVSKN